jgi:periplasmic divalent cation tolerance protein
MKVLEVRVNCPSGSVADAIARRIVEERLAASANIFAPIKSAYHWQGTVVTADEVPLVIKTRSDLFDRLVVRIRQLHPYDVPSILGFEITYINDEYARWVLDETADR